MLSFFPSFLCLGLETKASFKKTPKIIPQKKKKNLEFIFSSLLKTNRSVKKEIILPDQYEWKT